jgi:hypothetical protein
MIAFRDFFKPRPPARIRLPNPAVFVLIRGADREKIDAQFDATGEKLVKLIVHTRSPPPGPRRPR